MSQAAQGYNIAKCLKLIIGVPILLWPQKEIKIIEPYCVYFSLLQ